MSNRRQNKKKHLSPKQNINHKDSYKSNVNNSQKYSFEHLLRLYEQMNETQRYEGSGIWSRFNIITSLNVILFGISALIISNDYKIARILFLIVSLAGALFSYWGLYVLRRLWLWHIHWKSIIQEIESNFPKGFPTPFLSRPKKLKKKSSWFQTWVLSYTQPFILILLLMWVTLFILSYNGHIIKKQNEEKKTQIEIILKDDVKLKELELSKDTVNSIKSKNK